MQTQATRHQRFVSSRETPARYEYEVLILPSATVAPLNIFNITCDNATYVLDILRSVEMYLYLCICRLIFPVLMLSCSFGFILCYVTGLMWSVGVLEWKSGHAFIMDLYKIFSINYRRQYIRGC